MPVISIANPKGGAGCSTTALVLGTMLASKGAPTTILDCDPNHPLVDWKVGPSSNPVRIIGGLTESRIVPVLDEERLSCQIVLVDLEGIASRMVSRAITRSDLVLIPTQASAMDAVQAARVVDLVREEEEILDRHIPFRIVLNRTSPQIPTKTERLILKELACAGIPLLQTHLNQRTAFQAMFLYRQALEELDPALVNGIDGARINAMKLAEEIVDVLETLHEKRKAAA